MSAKKGEAQGKRAKIEKTGNAVINQRSRRGVPEKAPWINQNEGEKQKRRRGRRKKRGAG